MKAISFATKKEVDYVVNGKPVGTEIHYEENSVNSLTDCPFGQHLEVYPTGLIVETEMPLLRVGSMGCGECKFFSGIDTEKRIVYCRKEK